MIVGLTGGIGSGKTTVAQIFAALGVPIFVADEVSKHLIDTNKRVQRALQNLLGDDLVKEGKIDRPLMAKLIFNDDELLKKANAIIHPAVAEAFKQWQEKQDYPYVLREAAILFESGSHRDCAAVIVVSAEEKLRIKRVQQRSGESVEQIKARMSKQWPQKKKEELADYLIFNDEKEMLIPQVIRIHEDLIRRARQGS